MSLRLGRIAILWKIPSAPSLGVCSQRLMSGDPGDGAGKGGGSGGSIRSAGGAFGKMEAAREEQYFRNKQNEQLDELKKKIHDEIAHHEKQIADHEDAIERHKSKVASIEKMKRNE